MKSFIGRYTFFAALGWLCGMAAASIWQSILYAIVLGLLFAWHDVEETKLVQARTLKHAGRIYERETMARAILVLNGFVVLLKDYQVLGNRARKFWYSENPVLSTSLRMHAAGSSILYWQEAMPDDMGRPGARSQHQQLIVVDSRGVTFYR